MEEDRNKYRTNYALKITGWLGHDNKLFDRTCPQCRGMYSSFDTSSCPKCGQPLTYITTKDGKYMSISEGTIYPSFGPKQKDRDEEAIRARKTGMEATYRFKMFAFEDEENVPPTPPDMHHMMRKGVMIELMIINHQLIPSWYQTKSGKVKVELMAMIYPKYGDTIKILRQKEEADATVSFPVNADGTPAKMPIPYPDDGDINNKIKQIEQLLTELKFNKTKNTNTMVAPTEGPSGILNNAVENNPCIRDSSLEPYM